MPFPGLQVYLYFINFVLAARLLARELQYRYVFPAHSRVYLLYAAERYAVVNWKLTGTAAGHPF
jgi:hypothetical protein